MCPIINTITLIISIHALLAESDGVCVLNCIQANISIHALLAESDGFEGRQQLVGDISIHALLAESDVTLAGLWVLSTRIFLSTLSLRRATRFRAIQNP